MTHAKSLSSNFTLLVRPGLEPKIARFGGPHGVSCGRVLNPRHGPLHNSVYLEVWQTQYFLKMYREAFSVEIVNVLGRSTV
jgi:hypothetical protein